tara:strand:- start:524 stop:955 length:432 start_codon:yes stop_codon:yes gene_type:complete
MKSLKTFDEFLKLRIVKKQSPDIARATDLINESDRKYNSLNRTLRDTGLDNQNANDIIESCYDIIINLIRAKMLIKGLNSTGIGAHEAEVSFLRLLEFSETDVDFMNKLRYFRNGIMYYGKIFDKEYAKKVLDFMNKMRKRLK